MNVFDFETLNERGEFPFAPKPEEGMTRFYHGTSAHFRDRIENHGFLLSYRIVTPEQLRIIELYASRMPQLGMIGVWGLAESKRLNLAEGCNLAVNYASGNLKGGVVRLLYDDLGGLLEEKNGSIPTDHKNIFEAIREDLGPVASSPGIVYAVDFDADEVSRLHDRIGGLAHAPFDVTPDKIAFGVIVR